MTDDQLTSSNEVQEDYWSLMNKVLSAQQAFTKIHGHLQCAHKGPDHEMYESSLELAKKEARVFEAKFPHGIESAIAFLALQVKELNEEISTEKISDEDFGVRNSDFAECQAK